MSLFICIVMVFNLSFSIILPISFSPVIADMPSGIISSSIPSSLAFTEVSQLYNFKELNANDFADTDKRDTQKIEKSNVLFVV